MAILNKWTDEEIKLLLTCNEKTMDEVERLFPNRNKKGIQIKCSRLNIKITRSDYWRDDELMTIQNNSHLSLKELCELLPNRTHFAVQSRCNIMGIKMDRVSSTWVQEEVNIIKNNQDKTIEELLKLLPNKNEQTIRVFINSNNYNYKKFYDKYNLVDGKMLCNKCNEYKEYNSDNFYMNNSKYHTCNDCTNKLQNINKYRKKYNIILDFDKMFDTYTPEQWYEFYYNGITNKLPYEISRNKDYMNKIIKYAINTFLNKNTRAEVITVDSNDLIKLKLRGYFCKSTTISDKIIDVFPEFNIKHWELQIVPNNFWRDKKHIDEFMVWFIENNIDLENINIKNDIPKIFNRRYMEDISNYKMNFCISYYKHYKSYFEWLNSLYPEWDLKPEYFNMYIAKDNVKLNSREELLVYEFIKYDLKINIKSIGLKRKNNFYNHKYDENYYADFIIKDNKLNKPLIIEYYGLYNINNKNYIYQQYVQKTHRKNEFYKNNQDIYFIDLYSEDLINNLKGVRDKLTSFFIYNADRIK